MPIIEDKLAVRAVIYDDHQGGYIDNVPSTFTRSNEDLGNFYFNIKPEATGSVPTACPPARAGLCALPGLVGAPANNSSIAHKDFNPVTYTGRARLGPVPDQRRLGRADHREPAEHLDAEGLSVQIPVGLDFQPLKPLQVTSFTPSYNKDRYSNTAWTVNGKIGALKLIYTGGYPDRHIHQQMDYTNYSRTAGGMYYQCIGGSTGWGRRPAAATRRSPTGRTRSTAPTSATSCASARPDDWRLRVHRRRLSGRSSASMTT